MAELHAPACLRPVTEPPQPVGYSARNTSGSDTDRESLARQIAAMDGVTFAQAQQQIREMMGFKLDPSCPAPMTIYNLWRLQPSGRAEGSGPSPLDEADEMVKQLRLDGKLNAIPAILDVLCDITGTKFAAVSRAPDELEISGAQVNQEPRETRLYGVESYLSVPVIATGGRYFGNLCAINPLPSQVDDPRVLSIFKRFAQIIAQQLDEDINLRKQENILLEERAASELREQFIAILGHDLRNPLHAILATASILERRLDESGLIDMAARIKGNARRMAALLDDVMDFARGRLGSGVGIELKEVDDIAGDLANVVRELQDANPSRQIITDIRVSRRVYCDKGRVQQIASNLAANALTHGDPNRPVRFTASADEDYLTFSVWNDGEPIPAASIDKVFQPFWRHTVSTNRQGLGLGLHICSQIVQAHKGMLTVTSTRHNGTEFTARLPVCRLPLTAN